MKLSVLLSLLLCAAAVALASAQTPHDQAVAESLIPIRPGVPGRSAFWNAHAKQFMWAPAFDFPAVRGAAAYRFTISSEAGGTWTFEAAQPWAPLSPVWAQVPTGPASVKVEALDKSRGRAIAVAGERQFHRAAVFNGPYGRPILPYADSARLALDGVISEPFVQSWRTTGKPDPSYPLYRYASKLIAGVMTGAALYAGRSPRPPDADQAIESARRAAEFLLSISCAPGGPLQFMPPTYHDAKPTERENDHWTMLISPAEAGIGYLDLYDVTHDRKYLDAAARIADTYATLQLPSGTWWLKVDNRTAQPVARIELIPAVVITFLDRLVEDHGLTAHRPTLDRAVRWMMRNPVRTFDWSAQFDDAKLRGPCENLSKHEACEFACYLFRRAANEPEKLTTAEELLRFAEDQFVVWEHPPAVKARSLKMDPANWFTPCSLEQYAMYEPISGSSAFMIKTYVRAYQANAKPIYLAKARSLANALTEAQHHHNGRYPTRMVREDLSYWINSTVNTAKAMLELAEAERIGATGKP